MRRPVYRVDYELAYCAWQLLAPEWVAKYPQPQLSPWFTIYLDVVRAGVTPKPDDLPGQHIRRAIIAGATPDQPFPGEVRGKALLVEAYVRTLPIARVSELGSPGAVVRALGPALQLAPASRTA